MILFHGSDKSIDSIDLSKCRLFKDFGLGFYLSPSQKHAEKMADMVAKINDSKPVVNTFFFLIDETIEDVKIKVFGKPNQEWVDFIIKNRTQPNYHHNFDIVVGPVAGEVISFLIKKYEEGLLDIQSLLEQIHIGDYSIQYCFCSETAIKKLKKA